MSNRTPLLRGQRERNPSSVTAALLSFFVIAVLVAAGFLIWAVVVTVQRNDQRIPVRYTGDTVAPCVNDLFRDIWEREQWKEYPADDYPRAMEQGYTEVYGKIPTSAPNINFLDEPYDIVQYMHERRNDVDRCLNSADTKARMSTGQLVQASQILRPRLFPLLPDSVETPAECYDMFHLRNLLAWEPFGPVADAFRTFDFLDFYGPDLKPQDYNSPVIADDVTFQNVLDNLERQRNIYISRREQQFYRREIEYLNTTYGVDYPIHRILGVLDTFDASLNIALDSSDFVGGSSVFYDSVLFNAAVNGFTPSPTQLSQLQTAIVATEAELLTFFDHTLDYFNTLTFFDSFAGASFQIDLESNWFAQFPVSMQRCNSVEYCIEGVWSRNVTKTLEKMEYELTTRWRDIAEPILDNTLSDYLGWGNTWIHVFFGTEANVTELGRFAPVDCGELDPLDDPAALDMRSNIIEVQGTLRKLGDIHPANDVKYSYIRDVFGGCSSSGGNAFAKPNYGNDTRMARAIANNGPLQPRDGEIRVVLHEQMHIQQVLSATDVCDDCWFYRAGGDLQFFHNYESSKGLEGGATFAERDPYLRAFDIKGSGSLREAAAALSQIETRLSIEYMWFASKTGQRTPLEIAQTIQSSLWWPYSSIGQAEALTAALQNAGFCDDLGFQYLGGAFFLEELDELIVTQCPTPESIAKGRRHLYDSQIVHWPSIRASEAQISEFVSNGCTNWKY